MAYSIIQFTVNLAHPLNGEHAFGGVKSGLESATLAYSGDSVSQQVLPDGSVKISVHPKTNGTLTLSVVQGSDGDVWLQSLFNTLNINIGKANIAFIASMVGFGTDSITGQQYTLRGCSLAKPPNVQYVEQQPQREWEVLVAELTLE